MAHKFGGNWAMLVSDERRRAQPPEQILALVEPRTGETVLDLGTGPGFVALPLGEAVGPTGRVIAADISAEALEHLRGRAAQAGLTNIVPTLVEESLLPLGAASVDAALLINVLHELADPHTSIAELRRVLRPGGRLGIVDWDPEAGAGRGPSPAERVPSSRAAEWLAAAGFVPGNPVRIGPAFYGLTAAVPAQA